MGRGSGAAWRCSLRFNARLAQVQIAGRQVWLAKPGAYMNNSGAVVAAIMRKRGIAVQDLIVVLDDADLPLGQLRIRAGGGSGGHKGLQSIIDQLGQDRFARVRLGIGRRADTASLVEHVLSRFAASDRATVDAMIRMAVEALQLLLERGVAAAMNEFNQRFGAGGIIEKI